MTRGSSKATALTIGLSALVLVATEFVVIGLAPAMSAQLDMTPSQSGWLVTWFAIGSALAAPFLSAYLSDTSPAKVLGWMMLPNSANLILIVLPNFELAAALRVAQGAALPVYISFASSHLSQVYGAGKGVAKVYIGVTLGVVLAPSCGTFFAERFGWQTPVAGLGLLSVALLFANLRLHLPPFQAKTASALSLLRSPSFLCQLFLSVCVFSAMFAGYSYLTSLLANAGLEGDQMSIALLVFGAAGLAGNWVGGRTADHALAGAIVVPLLVSGGAMAFGLLATAPALLLTVVLIAWGMAHAAGFVLSQVRVMTAGPDHKSFAASMNIAAANVGIALGTFVGGWMLETGGVASMSATAALFAIMCVATVMLLAALPKRFRSPAPEAADRI